MRDPVPAPILADLRARLTRAGYEEVPPDLVVPGGEPEAPRSVPVHQRAQFRTRRDEPVMLPAELAGGLVRHAGARRPRRLFQIGAVARYRPEHPNDLAVEHRLGVQLVGAAGTAAFLEVVDLARDLRAEGAPLAFNTGALAATLFDRHGVPPERRRDAFADLRSPPAPVNDGGRQRTVEAALATLGAPGAEALGHLPAEQQRAVLLDLLAALDVRFIGRRRPEDVVDNLLRRIEAARHRERGREALGPLGALVGLRKAWVMARPTLVQLLGDALAPVDAVAGGLGALGFSADGLVFDGGLRAGELRDDELAFTLDAVEGWCGRVSGPDGDEVPVAGFEGRLAEFVGDAVAPPPQVLVVPVAEGEVGPALALARDLRAAGLVAELEVAVRGPRAALQYAVARDIPYVALIGEAEVSENRFLLKDMARRTQQSLPLGDVDAVRRWFWPHG